MAGRLLLAAVCLSLPQGTPAAEGDTSAGTLRVNSVLLAEAIDHRIRAFSLARQLGLHASVASQTETSSAPDRAVPQTLSVELRGSYANTKLWLREMLARHDDLSLSTLRMRRIPGDPGGGVATQVTLVGVPRPAIERLHSK